MVLQSRRGRAVDIQNVDLLSVFSFPSGSPNSNPLDCVVTHVFLKVLAIGHFYRHLRQMTEVQAIARAAALSVILHLAGCAPGQVALPDFSRSGSFGERTRVLQPATGVTATLVAPARVAIAKPVDLIIYALPNGNTTAQTMGRKLTEGMDWHYDIQHIGAQTRALRTRGLSQAIVAYLEADSRSWPQWRRAQGYDRANAAIVEIVRTLRAAVGNPPHVRVTLTGHSGGGSFMFGFIEGQDTLPSWLERIVFLDANYNFEPGHGEKMTAWLRRDSRHTLVVLAYDDREITLDGKKVVSDSGGTWRASQRMLASLRPSFPLSEERFGEFIRYHGGQVEILLHPNPENRILHTVMIGEMNGYMHGLLVRRPEYERGETVLKSARVYEEWVEGR